MSKKAVVLLHGFGEDATVWAGFVPFLQKSFRVVTPDYASLEHLSTMEAYATWIKELLATENIQQCTLIGHSMGGYIALAFAELFPEMVTGLGLFHSTAYADTDERKAIRIKNVSFLEAHGTAFFIKNFTPNLYTETFVNQHIEVVQKHIAYSSQLPVKALMTAMDAMRLRPDRRHVLSQAKYPVMFVVGKQDKSIPFDDAQAQLLLNPRITSLVLDQVAHMGMIEEPEECLRFVKKFLLT